MPCANGGIFITDNVTILLDLLKLESFGPHQEIAIQKYHPGSKGCPDLHPHRLSQPT